MEEGGLGRFIVLDGDAVFDGQFNGPLVGDGLGPGRALYKGKGPVVAVIWDAQEDFARGDLRDGIIQHCPDVGQGGYRHGRAGGVAPFVG